VKVSGGEAPGVAAEHAETEGEDRIAAALTQPARGGASVLQQVLGRDLLGVRQVLEVVVASAEPGAARGGPAASHGSQLGYVASLGAFREVFQEDIIIPPVRLVRNGRAVADIFRLVLAQIRSRHETAGDLRAKIAANNTGARRLSALVARMGYAVIRDYIDELIVDSERRARSEIALLPRGIFPAEGTLDNDGFTDQPVRLAARIIIDESGVAFDMNGCDPPRRAPVKATFAQTFSCCAYALNCLIGPDIPTNAGFYACVRVGAPAGTVVNSTSPAPVVGGWETNSRLTDVIFKALAPVLPERMPAETKAMIWHASFGGTSPRTHEYYCFLETLGGGSGARLHSDRPDAVQAHGQNTENASIEETERNYPLRIARYELVTDSEGPGRQRGGLGLRRDYMFPEHGPAFTIRADRDRSGPWGLAVWPADARPMS